MVVLEELQSLVSDLRQAIGFERRYRFINMQGKRQAFADYLQGALNKLSPAFSARWKGFEGIQARAGHYAYADLNARISLIEQIEDILTEFEADSSLAQKPKVRVHTQQNDPAQTPIQFVKGVGPNLADLFRKLGVQTVADLLYTFPKRYLDYQHRAKIDTLEVGQEATVIGQVKSIGSFQMKTKQLSIVSLLIEDETGIILANWMFAKTNRASIEAFKSRFHRGAQVMISGKTKWDKYKNRLSMDRPEIEVLSYDEMASAEGGSLHAGRIVPVYPMIQGLYLKTFRRVMRQALDTFLPNVADPLPEPIRKRYTLEPLQQALEQIHFPEDFTQYETARARLVFDELFYIQLRLALTRQQYKHAVQGRAFQMQPGGLAERFLKTLPFQLTGAQQRVFQDILSDMAKPEPMYRLLQGDVGSGKTVVAVLSLLIAIENGCQGVLMAPTEILAEQHYRNCIHWLAPLGVNVALVVGKAGAKARRANRLGLLNGQIQLAVGTHALIQDDIAFQRLGAVVVDEQHRFGVKQRLRLKDKGDNPDMLTMTATPIPRTLAMTLHGDLDVSVLDELPPGRTPIQTQLFRGKKHREEAYALIRHQVVSGRQVYIVFPLIEESETLDVKAAKAEFERLRREVFPELRMGLLHGRLAPEEKDAVMQAFSGHQLDVLVSTTVIEVGVDVPNATVMLIEDADRFGLAQLHQLRGRVGRGAHQSYCLLLTDSSGEDVRKRLNIVVNSQDGFEIAEQDLMLRGPGEFLGTKQSGMPDLELADLVQDRDVLEQARTAAFEWLAQHGDLSAYPELEAMMARQTAEQFSVLSAG
jgi:ATP-dependent DNA helicase RecG